MNINSTYSITRKFNNTIMTNIFGKMEKIDSSHPHYEKLWKIASILETKKLDLKTKNERLTKLYIDMGIDSNDINDRLISGEVAQVQEAQVATEEEKRAKMEALDHLVAFFSEFRFTPGARFVNTLTRTNDWAKYVANYFTLMDSEYATEVVDKIKSDEFKNIVNTLKSGNVPAAVNNRIKLYFGAPGSGKTTTASQETQNIIVCTSDMLPKDMMNVFGFDAGNPEFKKSTLRLAMENGDKIILDEINMLPFETLRFIQTITDGKASFKWENEEVEIKDGFQIIGTMNLNVNGETYAIPEPLIDRCSEIKEFKLDAKDLLQFVMAQDGCHYTQRQLIS